MSEIITALNVERERQEAAFIAKLTKLGLLDLVSDYKDIATIRNAAAVVERRTVKTRNPRASIANGVVRAEPPEGFNSLKDEVRKAVMEIRSRRFRAARVFDILAERFPTYITEEKKASIGATLSNLVSDQVLATERDSQRKVWYRLVTPNVAADDFDDDGWGVEPREAEGEEAVAW